MQDRKKEKKREIGWKESERERELQDGQKLKKRKIGWKESERESDSIDEWRK